MELLWVLEQTPAALVGVCVVFGLLVGSFLNVVIYRLPVMLERQWQAEARAILEQPGAGDDGVFNLVVPRSRCPHCGHMIRWYENIPVLSYALLLRGHCSACKAGISLRYPTIELVSGILSGLLAWQLGYGPWLVVTLLATWVLIALTMIDYDTTLLPDQLTLPLMWLGLLAAVMGISPVPLPEAVIGAAAGYLSLWSIYWLFKLVTGKEGMGYGDFKLLAALGAFVGWKLLPVVILMSSLVGAITGIALIVLGRNGRGQPIPFGPYLASAGFITLLWGNQLVSAYLGLFRFN